MPNSTISELKSQPPPPPKHASSEAYGELRCPLPPTSVMSSIISAENWELWMCDSDCNL